MKTKVKKEKKEKIKYPCLMELIPSECDKEEELVVLFTDEIGEGVVVHAKDSVSFVGEYNIGWDLDQFREFNGTVRMSN